MAGKSQVKIKTAVIGCGRIASGFDADPKRKHVATHIGAYRRSPDVDLVAVCDVSPEALKTCQDRWGIERGYTDHRKLFRQEQPELISICTLADTHLDIIQDALALTPVKGIFCEKPLAHVSRGAARILKACEKQGVILQVGHQRRFDPLHRALRDLLLRGDIGAPQRAVFNYTAGLSNTGTHMFDLLRFFFGEPRWVMAMPSPNPSHKPDDENLDGWIGFESGLTVVFSALDVKKYLMFELDCFCDEGRFTLKSSGFDLVFLRKGPSPFFSGYEEPLPVRSPFKVRYARNFMVNAVAHLVACMRSGHPSDSSGWDGLMALKMIEAARISAARGGRRIQISK